MDATEDLNTDPVGRYMLGWVGTISRHTAYVQLLNTWDNTYE